MQHLDNLMTPRFNDSDHLNRQSQDATTKRTDILSATLSHIKDESVPQWTDLPMWHSRKSLWHTLCIITSEGEQTGLYKS